jgi:hypothetical protein
MHEHLRFGGGVSASVLNPAVLILVLIAGVLICILPRSRAVGAFLAAALLIPMDQVLLIGPAHFPMLRVLVLFGIVRILKDKMSSKLPLFSGGRKRLDLALILFTAFVALNGMLLFQQSQEVVNELGNLYTVFGVYFLLRFLIRDQEDVWATIQTLAYIAAVVAVVMTYEQATGHNPYAVLGGARVANYAKLAVRDDRFRAQGPFSHSILAGTFGAVLIPLFVALWWRSRKYRKIAALGVISATVITLACNSSTPVLGYAAGVLALCLWPLRQSMRAIRWGIALTLVVLHLVMKAPVWHLISRIDITGGSSSWHRFMLVDQCIRHFGDWWLIGVKDTSVWGWDMWDTANQYVRVAAFHFVPGGSGLWVQISGPGPARRQRQENGIVYVGSGRGVVCQYSRVLRHFLLRPNNGGLVRAAGHDSGSDFDSSEERIHPRTTAGDFSRRG